MAKVIAFSRLKPSALFRRDTPAQTARDVIGWWESRRIPFNLIVGSAGLLTCISVGVVGLGSEILFNSEFGLPPPFLAVAGVLIYGIMANVFFTGGWVAEIALRRLWPAEADRFATTSFAFGLIFSVLLTLAPGALVAAGGLFKLIGHIHRM